MSTSSSSEESATNVDGVLNVLVRHVKEHPVLLTKSQPPSVKDKKNEALKELVKIYASNGVNIDAKGCLKKIANLKKRVKDKIDPNKTGNKRVKLLPHEKTFEKLLHRNMEPNPTILPPSCKCIPIFSVI